jgi:hypothetical protein
VLGSKADGRKGCCEQLTPLWKVGAAGSGLIIVLASMKVLDPKQRDVTEYNFYDAVEGYLVDRRKTLANT